MEERLNIQDLVDLMIQKHHLSAKNAEAFVREFFNLIIQGLEEEQQVKIKGLGTFKLTAISPRESVDVNTGERIKIEGHTRISFVQDTSLKDVINKPFAHFETVILNEGTHLEEELPIEEESPIEEELSADEEEGRECLIEEKSPAVQEPTAVERESTAVEQEPPVVVVDEPVVWMDRAVVDRPVERRPSVEDIIAKEIEEADRQYYLQKHFKKEKKKRVIVSHADDSQQHDSEESLRKKKIIFWITSFVALLAFCSWALWQLYKPVELVDRPPVEKVALEASVDSILQRGKTVVQPIPTDTATAVLQDVPQVSASPVSSLPKADRTHTLAAGETLCQIALKYYGSKDYWTYLYKSNEEVIENPDLVPVGTVLKIPELVKK